MKRVRSILIVAFAVSWSSAAFAAGSDDTLIAEGLCAEMTHFIDALADFTTTTCLPAGAPSGTNFIIITEKPVFSDEGSRKAWLLVSVGAIGKTLNDHPDYKADTILFADAGMAKQKQYFALTAATVKNMQRQTKDGALNLSGLWSAIGASLKPYKP